MRLGRARVAGVADAPEHVTRPDVLADAQPGTETVEVRVVVERRRLARDPHGVAAEPIGGADAHHDALRPPLPPACRAARRCRCPGACDAPSAARRTTNAAP